MVAMSTAVLRASSASWEPSVASRIVVGKMLIGTLSFPFGGKESPLAAPTAAWSGAIRSELRAGSPVPRDPPEGPEGGIHRPCRHPEGDCAYCINIRG